MRPIPMAGLLAAACAGGAEDGPATTDVVEEVDLPLHEIIADLFDANPAPFEEFPEEAHAPPISEENTTLAADLWLCDALYDDAVPFTGGEAPVDTSSEYHPFTEEPIDISFTGEKAYVRIEFPEGQELVPLVIYYDQRDAVTGLYHWGVVANLNEQNHAFSPCPDDVFHIHQGMVGGTWHLEVASETGHVRLYVGGNDQHG